MRSFLLFRLLVGVTTTELTPMLEKIEKRLADIEARLTPACSKCERPKSVLVFADDRQAWP